MVRSTTAAGTIIQTARGFLSLRTRSCSDAAPIASSRTRPSTAWGDMSNTTHSCPALTSRRTMLAPILPRPIIPNCMPCSSLQTR